MQEKDWLILLQNNIIQEPINAARHFVLLKDFCVTKVWIV